MKLLFDFLPIALFFAVYHWSGDIIVATVVLIPATLVQLGVVWWRQRRIEKMLLITSIIVILSASATIAFRDPAFIQWKPTVINALFGIAFLFSPLFGGQTLTQRMMGKAVSLPASTWRRLNLAWVVFFFAMATLNVYVFTQYDEATWVDFKLFGMLGLTLLFVIGQALFLARHLSHAQSKEGS
ncbi:septation protein A [Salinicola rhizosphaerae]|uniref:Inner membrane-spanning protein YciB n=1 Tax=Salinicola rhizosphaerae TaxID=1443141 RepID=A0ABQ3E670_9GAMM|nr:septation protein A [Salinicola rhizosphaerae]GHB20790.1 putative intracellular septation protein A [Salinicola rhizosphaerae]